MEKIQSITIFVDTLAMCLNFERIEQQTDSKFKKTYTKSIQLWHLGQVIHQVMAFLVIHSTCSDKEKNLKHFNLEFHRKSTPLYLCTVII